MNHVKPLWILSHARSGTHWLGGILLNTKKFNDYIINEIFADYYHCGHDKEFCLKHLPQYQIFNRGYFNVMKFSIDDKKYIKRTFPDIRFIHLYRLDTIARCISEIHGLKTKICNNFSHNYKRYFSLRLELDDREMTRSYLRLSRKNNSIYAWYDFLEGENYIDICYEKALYDIKEVKKAVEFALEEEVSNDYILSLLLRSPFKRMFHPDKEKHKERLRYLIRNKMIV